MHEVIAKRQLVERQDRVNNILNAARKLYFKKGYVNTTVRDIALKAKFSTGVIYFYFKGKDDIYDRICEEGFHILIDLMQKAAKIEGTPLDKIVAAGHVYVEFYQKYPDYFDILSFRNMGFRQVGLPTEFLNRLEELSNQTLVILNELIIQGIKEGSIDYQGDSWELTLAAWAAIEGVIFIHKRTYLDKYGIDFEKLINIQIELIIKSIVSQSGRPDTI